MSNLSQIIRSVQQEAAEMHTECLRDHIADKAATLEELTGRLENATTMRGSAPDGEMRYADAFGAVMATVIALAVFTVELTNRPAERAIPVSPN